MPRKPLSQWMVMNAIFRPGVRPTKEEILKVSSFFLCRFLGSNEYSTTLGNTINRFSNIPIDCQYTYADQSAKQQNLHRKVNVINYQHPKKDKNIDEILGKISRYYNTTKEQSTQYLHDMSQSEQGRTQLDRIMRTYEHGMS